MISDKRMGELFEMLLRMEDNSPTITNRKTGSNSLFNYSGTTRYATGRNCDFSYIKNCIKKWGELKICSVADNGMGLAIYGVNGYAFTNDKQSRIQDAIDYARANKGSIKDVYVNSNGAVMVLFGKNGYSLKNTASSLSKKLDSVYNEHQEILSVSLNENNDWIIVTEKYYYTSGTRITNFVKTAQSLYGPIDYAYLTKLGRIAICRRGIYYENIPSVLEESLGVIKFRPDNIKFTDSGYYCISNKQGSSRYLL